MLHVLEELAGRELDPIAADQTPLTKAVTAHQGPLLLGDDVAGLSRGVFDPTVVDVNVWLKRLEGVVNE